MILSGSAAFTSNASHELMTPISVLQTKMENLMLGTSDEEEQEKILGDDEDPQQAEAYRECIADDLPD